jgi:thiaminase/transcriptional activator TenA
VSGLCESLRADCGAVWASLHEHPFLRELAAGTLPLEKFRFYIDQDLHFLPDFARAIGLAIGRAEEEEMRLLVEEAQLVVGREIESERGLLRRVEELTAPRSEHERELAAVPAPATVAYSSWLLATAARGGALGVMVALLPCAWSYEDIAVVIADEVEPHPVYTEWVNLFASDEYVESIAERRATLDRLGADIDEARARRLSELFTMATRLELGFWDMAYSAEHWPDLAQAS